MEPARCIVAFLLDGLSIQLWKCTPAAVRLENWASNPFAISKESPRRRQKESECVWKKISSPTQEIGPDPNNHLHPGYEYRRNGDDHFQTRNGYLRSGRGHLRAAHHY